MTPKNFNKMVKDLEEKMFSHMPEEVKADFMEAAKLAEEAMAKKNPSPNFSSWPPEMPERECDWRKDDELQEYRLCVPEPTNCDHERFEFMLHKSENWSASFTCEPDMMQPMSTSSFTKIKVRENGGAYYAWSADGKTPIFPIPL